MQINNNTKSDQLVDCFHLFDLDENYGVFTSEKDAVQFTESVMHLIDSYLKLNYYLFLDEPDDFEDIIYDDVKEVVLAQFEDQIFMDELAEDEVDDMFDEAFEIYMNSFIRFDEVEDLFACYKQFAANECKIDPVKERYALAINNIRAKPQPTQRTPAWYEFRHNLITASNAWKAFESQAQINSLIYEKCQPMKTFETDERAQSVNINSSLHWGQKYEPLSVLLYEKENNVAVEDFGCIQHDTYSFLGASPDGIITDPSSPKFGRMLEIKNVVSREITGIPKKEYWVQMQLQMEVCNLDECDFLETKFMEYENLDQMLAEPNPQIKRGIIMYFLNEEGRPHYIYKILDNFDKTKIQAWEESMIESHQVCDHETGNYKMSWLHNYYWRCEVYSCVYIQRDRPWFLSNIGQLANVWSIIEKERETGHEHRAPKRRVAKDPSPTVTLSTENAVKKPTMLLNIIKLQQNN
jgi:putative phage-type endonuclease